MTVALSVSRLSKAYKHYPTRLGRLADWLMPWRTSEAHLRWVLKDVDFSLRQGEALGLVGLNGAGKSTLLKILAGTTRATSGQVQVCGRVSALLELGLGFHPDMSGRQNALLAAQLQGSSQAEAVALIPEIAAFAEIGDHFDQPVRKYSSGMQLRLAFSVATVRRPEILIVDEALAVGDAYFQHKSFERIRKYRQMGTALLIVSHDKQTILSICDRAILLKDGQIEMSGQPEAVLDYYNARLADHQNQSVFQSNSVNGRVRTDSGTGEARIEKIELVDPSGQPLDVAFVGQKLRARLTVRVNSAIESLVLGFGIKDRFGQMMFGTNTYHTRQRLFSPEPGSLYLFEVDFDANLGVGSYSVHTSLVQTDSHVEKNYHWIDGALVFQVVNKDKTPFVGCSWNALSFNIKKIAESRVQPSPPEVATASKQHSLRKLVMLDIGCRWGVSEKIAARQDRFQVYGFDPDSDECDRLGRLYDSPSISWVPVALAQTPGTRVLYLTQNPACSSMLQPDPDLTDRYPALACARQAAIREIEATTLDIWAEQNTIEFIDYIKLDTQGSELEILKGGERVLKSVRCLEIEVEFNPIYLDQPLYSHIDMYLRERGFVLWKLSNLVHYSRTGKPEAPVAEDRVFYDDMQAVPHTVYGGQLYWANAHYVRRDALNAAAITSERRALDIELFKALGMPDIVEAIRS